MRVAVFGSPAFAVPVLEAIHGCDDHEVVLVVTQPDKPVGRGLRRTPPPLARRAAELGLPLAQPERLRNNRDFHSGLAAVSPDVAVTAAYGKILPVSLLTIPEHGFLNVHASLLPAWRGAAPVQWALINGDGRTGVSIMQTEAGLDTGPVRHRVEIPIAPDERAPELLARLAVIGAAALTEALNLLARGALPLEPQDDTLATHAPMLTREDGRLDFGRGARASYDRYRGVYAWPGTYFPHGTGDVKVHDMVPAPGAAVPGTVLRIDGDGLLVACGEGALLLRELQSPGRRRLNATDWANGAAVRPGSVLGTLS